MPKIFDVIAEIESFGTRKERRFIFLTIFSLTIIFSIAYKQATGKDLASSFVVLLITLVGLFMGVFLLYAAFIYPKRDVKRYERLIARYIEDRKSTKIAIFFIFLAVLFFLGLAKISFDLIIKNPSDTPDKLQNTTGEYVFDALNFITSTVTPRAYHSNSFIFGILRLCSFALTLASTARTFSTLIFSFSAACEGESFSSYSA